MSLFPCLIGDSGILFNSFTHPLPDQIGPTDLTEARLVSSNLNYEGLSSSFKNNVVCFYFPTFMFSLKREQYVEKQNKKYFKSFRSFVFSDLRRVC